MNALIKQLTVPFLIVLLTLGLIYLFTAVFGPIPFSVKSTTTTTSDLFTVNGVGEETAVPDTAEFTVGVTKTAPTAEEAKNLVNEDMNAIIAELKALGIEEKNIKTQNFSTYPNQEVGLSVIGGRAPSQTSFTATQELRVTAPSVELANRAYDAASAKGANQIAGVSFTINDEDRKALEQKARKAAIADAKSKAQEIASDAGIKLGKVVNIYVADQNPPFMPMASRMDMAAESKVENPTNFQPGENTVTVNVTLSYETL